MLVVHTWSTSCVAKTGLVMRADSEKRGLTMIFLTEKLPQESCSFLGYYSPAGEGAGDGASAYQTA